MNSRTFKLFFSISAIFISCYFLQARLIDNVKKKVVVVREKAQNIKEKIKKLNIKDHLKKIKEVTKVGFDKVLKRKIITPTQEYNDNIKDNVQLNVPARIFSHNSFQYSNSIQQPLKKSLTSLSLRKGFRLFSIKERYSFGQALHEFTVYDQLLAGMRFGDLRIYFHNNQVIVSHGSPKTKLEKITKPIGGRIKLETIFKQIVQFLEDDVKRNKKPAILVFKLGGELISGVGPQRFEKVLKNTGLDKYVLMPKDWPMEPVIKDIKKDFQPASPYGKSPEPIHKPIQKDYQWPTYGWMRNTGKRIVFLSSPGKWSYDISKYFRQPGWDVKPVDKNSFLIYYLGLETDMKLSVKKIVERFEKFGEFGYDAGYGVSSLSVPFLYGVRDPNQDIRNSILMAKYVDYLIKNGYRVLDKDGKVEEIIWKGTVPSAIGGDSIGPRTGNLQKIANDYNKLMDVVAR